MKVRELMTSDVSSCQTQATLTQAAMIMWQRDCGVVPVVDEHQRVVGMVTDRDIAIAAATKNRLIADILVAEIIYGEVKTCDPNDNAEDALKIMRKHQLRRLPVTSRDGVLLGIISLSDFLRNVGKGKDKVPRKKLLNALRDISTFRPLHLHELFAEKKQDFEDEDAHDEPEDTEDSNDNEAISNKAATKEMKADELNRPGKETEDAQVMLDS
jgi:CBS domain-containing protein